MYGLGSLLFIANGVCIAYQSPSIGKLPLVMHIFLWAAMLFMVLPFTIILRMGLSTEEKGSFMGMQPPSFLRLIHSRNTYMLVGCGGIITGISALIAAIIIGNTNLFYIEVFLAGILWGLYMCFITKRYERSKAGRQMVESVEPENSDKKWFEQ